MQGPGIVDTKSRLRSEYTARINRVLDYIDGHLDGDLSLEMLAGVAAFSPFHFHRIFRAMTGETLARFIQRLRVERAANQLVNNPKKSITEIALDCGFSGSAAFARAFREAFGTSASEWRKMRKTVSNVSKANGKEGKANSVSSMYLDDVTHTLTWRVSMNDSQVNIKVEDFTDMTVAYVRHQGPYKGDSELFEHLFTTLCTWAGPRGLLEQSEMKMISVYHDDPDVTEEKNLRLSVCMTVPDDTEVGDEIGKMVVPGGKYAVGHFEILPHEYEEAWKAVYGGWMPESGYQPDDRPTFELYHNDPKTHPEGKHIVDICVPVKPL